MSSLAGRRVLVTGATGMVGVVADPAPRRRRRRRGRARPRHGSAVASWCAAAPRSEPRWSTGDLEDAGRVERAVDEHEVDTVVPPRRPDDRRRRPPSPLPRSRRTSAAPGTCSRPARLHPTLVRVVVVASSTRRTATAEKLPYTEDMPLAGARPLRRLEELHGPARDCPTPRRTACPCAIARCGNIYGGGDLNWSRIVPGTIRSRAAGRAAGAPQRRDVRARLHLRRGRRRRLPAARRDGA